MSNPCKTITLYISWFFHSVLLCFCWYDYTHTENHTLRSLIMSCIWSSNQRHRLCKFFGPKEHKMCSYYQLAFLNSFRIINNCGWLDLGIANTLCQTLLAKYWSFLGDWLSLKVQNIILRNNSMNFVSVENVKLDFHQNNHFYFFKKSTSYSNYIERKRS